jgi:hypothetical protein
VAGRPGQYGLGVVDADGEETGAGEALQIFDDLVQYKMPDGGLFVKKTFKRLSVEFAGVGSRADYAEASIARRARPGLFQRKQTTGSPARA